MTAQIYLVMIRDDRLALTVAGALKARLLGDGHDALVLVPSARALTPASQNDADQAWSADRWPDARRLRLVTVYEHGLLERLEALGLAAYVAVPPDQDGRVIRWAGPARAIMLPVASARDLVDAVAEFGAAQRDAALAAGEPLKRPSERRRGGRRRIALKLSRGATPLTPPSRGNPAQIAGSPGLRTYRARRK